MIKNVSGVLAARGFPPVYLYKTLYIILYKKAKIFCFKHLQFIGMRGALRQYIKIKGGLSSFRDNPKEDMPVWLKVKSKYQWFFLFPCLFTILSILLSSCGFERIAVSPGSRSTEESSAYDPSDRSHPDLSSSDLSLTASQKEFQSFCDSVFREEMEDAGTLDLHYMLRDPDVYGIEAGEVSLGTCSLSEMIKNTNAGKKIKEQLSTFDRSRLTDEQKILFDSLSDRLDTARMAEGLELYEQPLAPSIGIQAQLPILLAEYSFDSIKDVEDYLMLLSQIDTYYEQIIKFENQKAAAGLGPSDSSIDAILKSCESYLIDPDTNFLTETFALRLSELEKAIPLSPEQKSAFDTRHRLAIREHFIPAYHSLINALTALKGHGLNDSGLCGFKEGKRYYEYLVKSGPGVSYSVEELRSALSRRMKKDYEALEILLAENPSVDFHGGSFLLTEPEKILSDLSIQMESSFPALSECSYEIRYVPEYLETALSPAFYLTAPVDEINRNIIYINRGYPDSTENLYTTLAHEGFPGHLYQTVYHRLHSSSPLEALLSCSGANEGWATYVENHACCFDNGLSDAVGKYRALIRSFSLCVHGILDIGINYDGWTKEQTKQFITSCFHTDEDTVNRLWQTMIDTPANYLEYCGGYVEYMEMREQAEEALGNSFSPLEFHTFLLDLGPMPFSVIRSHFEQWLAGKKYETAAAVQMISS